MSKAPSPKYDQLRALREARYLKGTKPAKSVGDLRKKIALVPAKKPRKEKRR